jgi:uncharacterized protein YigA (DUF484 family)
LDRSEDQKTITRRRRVDAANAAAETRGIGAEDVTAYLRKHPDFLAERADLLAVLTPPALRRGESVVDMQHFMLQRLRSDLARAKTQQRALIATSRSNLTSQNRIHAAVLAILAATSFEQLLQTVTTDLAVLLDVDVVTIGVESAASAQPRLPLHGIQILRRGTVDDLLGPERDTLLRADTPGDTALFGPAAGLVRSQALLRLDVSEHAPVGLLCIGTRRPDRFHPGQGTELLSFLARVTELTIAAWLDLAQ